MRYPPARRTVARAVVISLLAFGGLAARPAASPDLSRVVGAAACRDCHRPAHQAWEKSRHAASRSVLDTPAAGRIREALGIKDAAETSEVCAPCHATVRVADGRRRAISGVSCESCHGPAAEWLKVHADFGSGRTRATEKPEHRDDRLGQAIAAGMLRPDHFYRVVQNCFECHTVPNESVVNRGGHSAGSAIELVAWSQGVVRHNFGPEGRNAEAPIERRRMIYVMGQMLDLEFALRGLASATTDGKYAQALTSRGEAALAHLKRVGELVPLAEVRAAIEAGSVRLAVGNGKALLAAAEAVSSAAQDFGDEGHRDELAALDPLLPAASDYRGAPHQP